MGRPITDVMIIDNSPHSYAFNPENAIPCESWFDDMNDHELYDLIPVLQELAKVDNVITELEARKMNGYSALMGLNNSASEQNSSEYYSTTTSYTSSSQMRTDSSSWVSNSQDRSTSGESMSSIEEASLSSNESSGSGSSESGSWSGSG